MTSSDITNLYTSSPIVVLPPNLPDQYFAESHFANALSHGAQTSNGGFSNPLTPSTTNSVPPTPGSLAGRKRSRGDIHAPDEEDFTLDGSLPTPLEEPQAIRGEPVMGPGMTLIYPSDPAYVMAAESQSGTWVEEDIEHKPFLLNNAKRPSVASRKSQRLGSNAAASDHLAQLVLPPQMRQATVEPLIDEATRVLGISWVRMDSSEALQISRKAYMKWISNHYPGLKDIIIWFENSAIPGYLVAAINVYNGQQEYYIFSQDLTEARLVTRDATQLVPRLQMLPALHLAAPGGCIRAELESATATNSGAIESNQILASAALQTQATPGSEIYDLVLQSPSESEQVSDEICGTHEMELD